MESLSDSSLSSLPTSRPKVAVVSGVTGQDGSYLVEFLLEKKYNVHGLLRRCSHVPTERIEHIMNHPNFHLHYCDLADPQNIYEVLLKIERLEHQPPHEVYNLAAQSHVQVSFAMPMYTAQVDALGTLAFLNAIKELQWTAKTKFYQASTSEKNKCNKINMDTHTYPNTLTPVFGSLQQSKDLLPCTEPHCRQKCKSQSALKKHLWDAHDKGGVWIPCSESGCTFQCKTKGNLKIHVWNKHEKGDYEWISCTIPSCNFKCKTKSGLNSHLWHKHNQGNGMFYSCTELNCTFCSKTNSDLKRHLWTKHNQGNGNIFSCTEDKCGYTCKNSSALKRHRWDKHSQGNGNTFFCTVHECDFKCKSKSSLKRHLWCKHNQGDGVILLCTVSGCNFKCKNQSALKIHLWQRHTQGNGSWFPCQEFQCQYKSKNKTDLKSHMWQIHSKGTEKWFVCQEPQCGYKGKASGLLKQHHNSHHTKQGQQRKKKKEEKTALYLTQHEIVFDRESQIDFKCALGNDISQSFARIDFIVQRPDIRTVFLIEVDEFSHSSESYQLSCELRRMTDAVTSMMVKQPDVLHWVWIRYNPDRFTIDKVKQKITVQDRLASLVKILKTHQSIQGMEIIYLYYSSHTNAFGIKNPDIFNNSDFHHVLKPLCSVIC